MAEENKKENYQLTIYKLSTAKDLMVLSHELSSKITGTKEEKTIM